MEHAGGSAPGLNGSVDDSHSYNTNIDFLNHFAATNSIATTGEMQNMMLQQPTVLDQQRVGAQLPSNSVIFESFNPQMTAYTN